MIEKNGAAGTAPLSDDLLRSLLPLPQQQLEDDPGAEDRGTQDDHLIAVLGFRQTESLPPAAHHIHGGSSQ